MQYFKFHDIEGMRALESLVIFTTFYNKDLSKPIVVIFGRLTIPYTNIIFSGVGFARVS